MLSASVGHLIERQYATGLLIFYKYFTLLLVRKVIDQMEMYLFGGKTSGHYISVSAVEFSSLRVI